MASPRADLTLVRGLAVGHAQDPTGSSGVTVVRFRAPTPTVVDVRGGAPGTYDTASLALETTYGRRWAIFLTGGSLFGLDAARGVRAEILASGGGQRVFANPNRVVPISGAVLFDLPKVERALPDYEALGAAATRAASRRAVGSGRVGAGTGATVGKYLGRARSMPGGLASAGRRLEPRGAVGVLVAVNAVGAVRDPSTGRWVAGARNPMGRIAPPGTRRDRPARARGTTLAIVATDLAVERSTLARIAAIVHAGLGRAIVPYLTSSDGDTVFAASTGVAGPPPDEAWPGATADRIGTAAAELAVAATLGAVLAASHRAEAGRTGAKDRRTSRSV